MAWKILVTEPVPDKVLRFLRDFAEVDIGRRGRYASEDHCIADFPQYDAVLTMLSNPVTGKVIAALHKTRIIANYAVGYNNIDIEAAKKAGIHVSNTPDVLTDATADLAVGLLLAVARRIPESEMFLREGHFDGWNPMGSLGIELSGKRAAILGMGRIGKAIARRLLGFGMLISYHNRTRLDPGTELQYQAQYIPDTDTFFRDADVVILSCPLTAETRHILDRRRLGLLSGRSVVINIGRGPLVDEAALAEALHQKRIFGAGLDVYEHEPRVHPELLTAPGAVLLPHIGSSTDETREKMGLLAASAIRSILEGRNPADIPNILC